MIVLKYSNTAAQKDSEASACCVLVSVENVIGNPLEQSLVSAFRFHTFRLVWLFGSLLRSQFPFQEVRRDPPRKIR